MPHLRHRSRSSAARWAARSVDRSRALVTSANFTEAAQDRNIEVGLLVRHTSLGLHDALRRTGVLCPIGLGSGP